MIDGFLVMLCSAIHTASPFDQLVAALGTDKVVGHDRDVCPLSIEELEHLVAHRAAMQSFVADNFRVRDTNMPLPKQAVRNLSTFATSRLAEAPNMQGTPCGHLSMPHFRSLLLLCMPVRRRGRESA